MRHLVLALTSLLACLSTLLGGCHHATTEDSKTNANQPGLPTRAYSTTFPKAEDPLSENGIWIVGHASGARPWIGSGLSFMPHYLWGNVETSPGLAYGTDEPTDFGDPTAIVAGSWGAEQTVTAKVRIAKTPRGPCCEEVELRLRTTISNYSITGYEAYCSVSPQYPYCHIARWNGPNGSWWNFETGSSPIYAKDGDVLSATVTGANPTLVTLFRNGKFVLNAVDTGAAGGGFGAYGPWTSGNPGIGFYNTQDNDWKDFGFSYFAATDNVNNDPR